MQGLPGPTGEKGETGDVGQLVRPPFWTVSQFLSPYKHAGADGFLTHRVPLDLQVPEDQLEPQEQMAPRGL